MKSLPETRAKASQQWLDEAAKTLRDNGYVVIPRERHVVLTVDKTINGWLLETMGPEEAPRFHEYCDRQIGFEMGHALRKHGAITKEDLGRCNCNFGAYRFRYQACIILPKP